jgi:hypothetical protein
MLYDMTGHEFVKWWLKTGLDKKKGFGGNKAVIGYMGELRAGCAGS